MASQGGLKEVVSLYQTLIKEWNRKPVDLEKVGKLLSGMKVYFYFCLVPSFDETRSVSEKFQIHMAWPPAHDQVILSL